MVFAINIDWSEELGSGKWTNRGRYALEQNCKHRKGKSQIEYSGYCDKCDVHEDSAEPMMNYMYPLEFGPDEDKILEIVQKTNCTVMENEETGEFFLALCGGGMDLSQDIALAYIIAEKWIPTEMLGVISSQENLSQSGKEFRRIAEIIAEQSEMESARLKETAEKWRKLLKK